MRLRRCQAWNCWNWGRWDPVWFLFYYWICSLLISSSICKAHSRISDYALWLILNLALTKSNWMGCWMVLYLQAWALCPPMLDQSLMSEYFLRLMLKLKSVELNCNSSLAVVRLHRLYFDLLQSKMALLLVADSLQISFLMCPRRLKSIAPGLNFSIRVKIGKVAGRGQIEPKIIPQ